MLAQVIAGLRKSNQIPNWLFRQRGSSAHASSLQRLLEAWWYYSIELEEGRITKGIYPSDLPMLPRIMLRRCQFNDLDCLDLGSMEGLIPVLMSRQGARRVTATDFNDHCAAKLAAVQKCYGASFDFQRIGLLYDLDRKLTGQGYDLINLSGLLYHVFSPLLVLAAVRPLLKRNGLLLVSTNVVMSDGCFMEFNNHGRMQMESNTFWYPTVRLFDYLLRLMKLAPIDCEFVPHQAVAGNSIVSKYVFDKPSGYLSVVCRATDDVIATHNDVWMQDVGKHGWEHVHGVDWRRASNQPVSKANYKHQNHSADLAELEAIDLYETLQRKDPLTRIAHRHDSHTLCLNDQI